MFIVSDSTCKKNLEVVIPILRGKKKEEKWIQRDKLEFG